MKPTVNNLHEALSYQLQKHLYIEKKLHEELIDCGCNITSDRLRAEVKKYADSTNSKLLKLERIFNHIMQEPVGIKNDVIAKLMEETHCTFMQASSAYLKDIMMLSCIQGINAYKISSYRTSCIFAASLDLDIASDHLHDILQWEIEAAKSLSDVAIDEFNKIGQVAD